MHISLGQHVKALLTEQDRRKDMVSLYVLFFSLPCFCRLRFSGKTSSRPGHRGRRKQKGKRQAFFSTYIDPVKLSLAKAVQAQHCLVPLSNTVLLDNVSIASGGSTKDDVSSVVNFPVLSMGRGAFCCSLPSSVSATCLQAGHAMLKHEKPPSRITSQELVRTFDVFPSSMPSTSDPEKQGHSTFVRADTGKIYTLETQT